MTISILNWSEHYQTDRSSRLKDPKWLPIPVAHDVRFLALNGTENGCAAVAVMLSLLRLAACGNPKGSLIHGDRELSIDDLSKLSGIPTYIIDKSLPLLQCEGLIEYTKSGQGRPSRAQNLGSDVLQSRGDKSRREENRQEPDGPQSVVPKLPASLDPVTQLPFVLVAPDIVSSKPIFLADTQSVSLEISAEDLYQIYPRKAAKGAAIRAIVKALKTQHAEKLLDAVIDYARAVASWPQQDRKFVPYPATWFNQERYLDDPKEWQREGGGTSSADVWEEKHSRSTKDLEQVFKDLYSKGDSNAESS